ncbi:MAG: hypothetical protein MJ240_09465 [Kiritimatiellae bacterium]|nr:hypothetical protein [Kiritimatiellia bacterium]
MNVVQPLIDLQEVDGRIRELEREAKDIPRRKALETARLAGVNAALEIAQSHVVALQRRVKEDEVEAEEIRAKVRDLKTAQLGIKSNKEMQQAIIQIESLEHEAEAAENRALALQADEMPSLEARVREAQEKVDAEKGGVDGFVDELDQRLAEVKAELAQLAEERTALVAKVTDPKMRLYYERIRTKRWPAVVLLTDDGVCDGCHLVQPPSVAQMVQHNQGLVACTMCGRILYRDL